MTRKSLQLKVLNLKYYPFHKVNVKICHHYIVLKIFLSIKSVHFKRGGAGSFPEVDDPDPLVGSFLPTHSSSPPNV